MQTGIFTRISLYIRYAVSSLLILLVSCAVNPVTGQNELMLISERQELQIGKDAAPSATWDFGGHYRDSALESYLGAIVKRLWKISERAHLPVEFHILNTSVPNAFALPGYVAITRGLLSEMKNEAQFAAVMGHEIGHVMARHTAQRLSRMQLQQIGLAIGAASLGGSSGGDTLLKVGAMGSSLLLLNYSRSQEIQSDRLGVKYMSSLGYDPHEAISAHEVLQASADNYLKRLGKSRHGDSFMSNLLSTHPRQEVRISEIQGMIDQLPPFNIKGDGKFSTTFLNATKKMQETNKVYFKYDKAQTYYQEKKFAKAEEILREAINQNDHQAAFYSLLGFIKLQQKNYGDAKNAYSESLSIDPLYQPSIYGMGLFHFFDKNYRMAIDEFNNSLKYYPKHAQSHFGLGASYFKLSEYSKAIPYLNSFAQAVPRHPEVHGYLGICFDNRSEIRSAVISYRNQLAVAPDTELGRHAQKRLDILEPYLKK
jgi:predicted Zn-dependent protease